MKYSSHLIIFIDLRVRDRFLKKKNGFFHFLVFRARIQLLIIFIDNDNILTALIIDK